MREPGPLRRYLVFAGHDYYPGGGWEDFESDHDDLAEASRAAFGGGWSHVVDTHTGERVSEQAQTQARDAAIA